jgi:hypothetical protein
MPLRGQLYRPLRGRPLRPTLVVRPLSTRSRCTVTTSTHSRIFGPRRVRGFSDLNAFEDFRTSTYSKIFGPQRIREFSRSLAYAVVRDAAVANDAVVRDVGVANDAVVRDVPVENDGRPMLGSVVATDVGSSRSRRY